MMTAIRSINLVLRFLLELAALAAIGYWGFTRFDPWPLKIVIGLGLPVLMAAAWGIFRVPNDGGAPVVAVAGPVRLLLEIVYFAFAVYALAAAGLPAWAKAFAAILVAHYAIGYQRTLALLTGRPLL